MRDDTSMNKGLGNRGKLRDIKSGFPHTHQPAHTCSHAHANIRTHVCIGHIDTYIPLLYVEQMPFFFPSSHESFSFPVTSLFSLSLLWFFWGIKSTGLGPMLNAVTQAAISLVPAVGKKLRLAGCRSRRETGHFRVGLSCSWL